MVKKRPEKIQALLKIQPIPKLIQTSVSFLNKFPHLAMVCEQLDIGHEQNKTETYPMWSWIFFPSISVQYERTKYCGYCVIIIIFLWTKWEARTHQNDLCYLGHKNRRQKPGPTKFGWSEIKLWFLFNSRSLKRVFLVTTAGQLSRSLEKNQSKEQQTMIYTFL